MDSEKPADTSQTDAPKGRTTPKFEKKVQRTSSKRQQIVKKLSAVGGTMIKTADDYIKEGAEACQVFAGITPAFEDASLCVVRLSKPITIPEWVDSIPIRFILIMAGPALPDVNYGQVGRALATIMANPAYQEIAYSAIGKDPFLDGLHEFMDSSVVVPPGEIYKDDLVHVWDVRKILTDRKMQKLCESKQRKESENQTQKRVEKLEPRQAQATPETEANGVNEKKATPHLEKSWKRTGRLFGGLRNDFKNRFSHYASDFKDALRFQTIIVTVFMFFVAFSPAISFGQVMNERFGGLMGITEVFITQFICGLVWALFSGQPILIQAATGPFLVFETALFTFCKMNGLEFLPVRIWVALWTFVISIVVVLVEGSFLVGYITRFTEDIFTCLIAGIFILEAAKFVVGAFLDNPLLPVEEYCSIARYPANFSFGNSTMKLMNDQPNTAMISMVLVIGTFSLAFAFKQIRTSHFFGRTIRKALGDFGVPITILIMVMISQFAFSNSYLEFINMPPTFGLTEPTKRGWFIHPMGMNEMLPIWVIGVAVVPAMLIFILLFAEIDITELLLCSKERGLKKPMGFHWDLILCGGLMFLVSLLGLPWATSGAVQSLTHATALTVMKRSAPGEKPTVDYVVEQRVTTLAVAILIGACSFLGKVLRYIPIAVLLGVFLYLGVSCLLNVQLVHRFVLLFIPRKYFPDLPYCKEVSMRRVHAYTLCQFTGFAILWTVHVIPQSSLAFPFVIALNAVARRFLLPRLFSDAELKLLDGHGIGEEEHDVVDSYDESPLPM